MTTANCYRTKTGIAIGLAYMAPPKRDLGSEAERIQGALLSGAGGAMHPSNWRSIDRLIDDDIVANRSRFDEAMEAAPTMRIAPLRRPAVIPLDNSLLARAARWLRNLRLKGPL